MTDFTPLAGHRAPFPLAWPPGWKRTINRERPRFEAVLKRDCDSIIRQLQRRGSKIVITSDLPTRSDGLPYASATCNDPGIAVYWTETRFLKPPESHELVIACDRWKTAAQNVRAIEMSLVALRGLDRWGASEMVKHAFSGFRMLPAGTGGTVEAVERGLAHVGEGLIKRPWREVLKLAPHEQSLVSIKFMYRKLIALAHPDHGGTQEQAAELNAAMAEAEAELKLKLAPDEERIGIGPDGEYTTDGKRW